LAFDAARHAPARIFQPRRIVHQSTRSFDFRLHVGDHPLDGLEFADGLPKRAVAWHISRLIEGALRQADCLRGDSDAPAVQRAESDLHPCPSSPRRFSAGTSQSFRMISTVAKMLPHFFFVTPDAKTLESRLDEKRGEALAAGVRRPSSRKSERFLRRFRSRPKS